jgi:ABC-type antimicrobial peptide transport system permease subunit
MYNWWDGEDALAVYVPLGQAPPGGVVQGILRVGGDPAVAAAGLRAAVRSTDASLPVDGVRTMRQAIADSTVGLSQMAGVMAACGCLALVLSLVGIYGVVSYAVSRRCHEFGVRLAVGATSGAVMRLVLGQALALTAVGVATGLLLAGVLGRAMAAALFGVVGLEPVAFAATSLLLATASIGAALLPARRVLRLDPARILSGRG